MTPTKLADARHPAECFPVGKFVEEEMEAREWSTRDVAERMGGDNIDLNECVVAVTIHAPDEPGLLFGQDEAEMFARAFGTSAEFWMNIDRSWREWLKNRKVQP